MLAATPHPRVRHPPIIMTVVMAPASAAASSTTAAELCATAQSARELALQGDYDNACIYYGGLLAKLQQYIQQLPAGGDPQRRGRWLALQQQFVDELDEVKGIQLELREIAMNFQQPASDALLALRRQNADEAGGHAAQAHTDPAAFFRADPDVWQPPVTARDPDVWSPPSPSDMR